MSVESPYIPRRPSLKKPARRPGGAQLEAAGQEKPLSLLPLTAILVKGVVTGLPKQIGTLGLRVSIAFMVNTVLGSIATWKLNGFLAGIVGILVFLTASYNSIIPKALFWVLVMTIGVKLFKRLRTEGFAQIKSDFTGFIPSLRAAWTHLGTQAIMLMGVGGGVGFALANFLSRNNRMNKMLVCYVAAFSIIDALSRGPRGLLFLFAQAAVNDAFKLIKRPAFTALNHTYIAAMGVACGLVGNTLFALIIFDYGGYLLGAALVAGSVAYHYTQSNHKQQSAQG